MRHYTLLFILLSSLYTYAQKKDTSTYFEGYIEYKAEFKSLMQGISDNELRERLGQHIQIYFKDGNVKWLFRDDAGYLKSSLLINQKGNMYYGWSDDNPDTVFSFQLSSSKRVPIDSIVDFGSDVILGYKCIGVKLFGFNVYEAPAFSIPTIYHYFFCSDLKINPIHYEKFKEMRWDEVTKKYKSIALKIVTEFKNSLISTFTAINIKSETLSDDDFKADKTKFIKPTFAD